MLKKVLITIVLMVMVLAGITVYQLRSQGFLRAPQYDSIAPVIPSFQRPAVLVLILP
jgi:hypothetical protein